MILCAFGLAFDTFLAGTLALFLLTLGVSLDSSFNFLEAETLLAVCFLLISLFLIVLVFGCLVAVPFLFILGTFSSSFDSS